MKKLKRIYSIALMFLFSALYFLNNSGATLQYKVCLTMIAVPVIALLGVFYIAEIIEPTKDRHYYF